MNTFIDCGTHHGQGLREITAIEGIDSSWAIHTFEPNPTIPVHRYLADYPHNVNIHRAAVGVANRMVPFHAQDAPGFPPGHGQGAGIHGFTRDGNLHGPVMVPEINIVHFMHTLLPIPDTKRRDLLFKLDIEGYEYPLLRYLQNYDLLVERIAKMYVEWHPSPPDWRAQKQELIAAFQSRGVEMVDWK